MDFIKPALIEIDEKLKSTGMSQIEVDLLMARFLEEEAEDYVKCKKHFPDITENVYVLH